MRIAIAQLHPAVGDLQGNALAIVEAIAAAARVGASLVVTPELALCGAPWEDSDFSPAFTRDCGRELAALAAAVHGAAAVVGFAEHEGGRGHSALAVVRAGRVVDVCRRPWPTSRTAAEGDPSARSGAAPCVFEVAGTRFGCLMGEDIGTAKPAQASCAAGANVLIVAAGSRYDTTQHAARRRSVGKRARENRLPVLYVNRLGGADGAVCDGASFVCDARGELTQQLPAWRATLALVTQEGNAPQPVRGALDGRVEAHVYEALVLAVREHVMRRRSRGVQVVLCEDLASALAGAIAVDALGSARVGTIVMPSVAPAPGWAAPATSVGVAYEEAPADALVVATHEHAERIGALASLALLEDVPPDLVYELATYRNAFGRVFPKTLLTRRSSLAASVPREGATRSSAADAVRIRPRAAAPAEGGAASRPKRGRRGLV